MHVILLIAQIGLVKLYSYCLISYVYIAMVQQCLTFCLFVKSGLHKQANAS